MAFRFPTVLLAALGCLLAAPAVGQAQDARRPLVPTVWIAPASGLQPVGLDSVSIDVRVAGFVARTRMELVFHNPNGRILEGEFVFPLGAGQTVAGYELDVDGRMRGGVVVPKETARVAFEDITRQQVDPGLAELTQGNVFRTRLYPIPAQGHKRIALVFEQTLLDAGDAWRYVLPLAFDQPVRRFSVNARADVAPDTVTDGGQSPDSQLRFEHAGLAWVAAFEQSDITPRSELAFKVPKRAGTPVLEAADPLEPAWRSVVAQVETGLPDAAVAATRPRHIAIFYDASGSASRRDRDRELVVIDRYLRQLGDVEVSLLPFRDAMDAATSHRVRAGNTAPVLDAIRALPLDGGSSYGAIDTGSARGADVILVVGDGLSNFGSHEPRIDSSSGPIVHVVHASQLADHARLASIARRGGGRVIDLLAMDADQAVAAMSTEAWQLLSIASSGDRCRDFSPSAPDAVGATVVITARCRGSAEITLVFGRRGGETVPRSMAVGVQSPVADELAPSVHRLWAQAHIATIEAAAKPVRDAIVALGVRYGVVTRHTSLLVLDRIDDYVRYGIEPREADLRAAYRAAIANQPKQVADPGRAERIQALVSMWQEFRQWHQTRHPWLETVLVPAADLELARWNSLSGHPSIDRKRLSDRLQAAGSLRDESNALAKRWLAEGADPSPRREWERQAAALMQRIAALRQERLALAPESETIGADDVMPSAQRSSDVMPAPPPAPPSPALARNADLEGVAMELAPVPESQPAEEMAPPPAIAIELRGWDPDTPYLDAIRTADDAYAAYLAQRAAHGDTPAFFLDSADYFRDVAKDAGLALRVLSNIAELSIENTELTRVLGYRLAQWERYGLAVGQFESALAQRPEEPQSYRDLALALSRLPVPEVQRAVALLWTVATRDWHGRFPGIELIALHELNAILAAAPAGSAPDLPGVGIPPELVDPLAVGLRVVMTWDADNTDIDLWVIDPAGEKAYYGHPRTQTGGRMSQDFTQGYGPEVFLIRRPLPGVYRVQANYFGDRRQSLTGPVTVQIEFQTRFGESMGERKAITRRLESGRQIIDLGEFTVELE